MKFLKRHKVLITTVTWVIILVVVSVFLAWFGISIIDVINHNQIHSTGSRFAWNIFDVLMKISGK